MKSAEEYEREEYEYQEAFKALHKSHHARIYFEGRWVIELRGPDDSLWNDMYIDGNLNIKEWIEDEFHRILESRKK